MSAIETAAAAPQSATAMESKAVFAWDDPLLLEDQLSEEERMVRDAARDYCQDKLMPRIVEANRDCYRAQCFATARLLGERLDLPRERWVACFQSRLGRTPWIRPYTDEVLAAEASRG